MAGGSHSTYGQKFERLLELFPHPDRRDLNDPEKRKWKMSELSEATGGELSRQYLSGIRRDRNNKPGMRPLDMIANVMGFPFELWLAEPEQWRKILSDREMSIVPSWSNRATEQSLAELLEQLFNSITNRKTGKPFTNREVADNSGGRLTEQDLEDMRAGEFTNPSRAELLALSNAFGVDVSYWYGSSAEEWLMDERFQDALQGVRDERRYQVLKKSFGYTDDEVDALLQFMERFGGQRGHGSEGN